MFSGVGSGRVMLALRKVRRKVLSILKNLDQLGSG